MCTTPRDGYRAISCRGHDRPGRTFRACRQATARSTRLVLRRKLTFFLRSSATPAGAGCPPDRAERGGAGGGPNALIIKRRREGRRLWSTRSPPPGRDLRQPGRGRRVQHLQPGLEPLTRPPRRSSTRRGAPTIFRQLHLPLINPSSLASGSRIGLNAHAFLPWLSHQA